MEGIQIQGLTKIYKDVVAVDHLNLSIPKGELFALLGVNGAGKTTTIQMLSSLTQPTEGTAYLNGISVTQDPATVRSIIALSPQETAVAMGLTVYENLKMMWGLYGLPKVGREERITELVHTLGLGSVITKRAAKLSGGYQRRLSIAMALISDPSILFLDEPTLGLDIIARSELWELIRSLKGKVTIILTTHYMEEAENLADRIGIMKDGRLLVCDTPQGIMEQTRADRFDQAFLRVVKGVAQ